MRPVRGQRRRTQHGIDAPHGQRRRKVLLLHRDGSFVPTFADDL
ncbi:MAG: hypothetical protein R2873_08835 [Caldilineaceae bacterium]